MNGTISKPGQSGERTALLILNKSQSNDFRVLVTLRQKHLVQKVDELLINKKRKEAFDLFYREGEVNGFYPIGAKLIEAPQLTLMEDIL